MINGLALLGWNPPHREDSGIVGSNLSTFLKHEVMSMKEIEELVIFFLFSNHIVQY